MGFEPEVNAIFEPQSETLRCFNLFEEASSPYVEFVNTPVLIGDIEGPKALADRFGPLDEGPQYVDDWTWAIKMMQNALKAWKRQIRQVNSKRSSEAKHSASG